MKRFLLILFQKETFVKILKQMKSIFIFLQIMHTKYARIYKRKVEKE